MRNIFYTLISAAAIFLLSLPLVPQFLPSHSFAEVGIDPVTTLSISPSSTLSLIAEPGSFVSGTETINVSTNNYTGYTLTMTTNGNSTDLLSSSTDVTIPTITLPEGVDSITSTDFTTAGYGYSLNSTDFMPVPSTDSEGVVIATTTPEDPRTNDHTLTFGAKTDITTPAGTYEKTFTISAVANATLYDITFDANAGTDTVTNMPNVASGSLSGIDVILPFSPMPTRTGYLFLGWDEDKTATEPTYTSSGTSSFPLDPEQGLETNTHILYAIWGCGNGYICYDDNGADEINGGKGTMNPSSLQSNAYSAGASATLVAPNYSKAGYGFVGWSETPIDPEAENVKAQISALAQDETRTIYGPNETITMPEPQGPKQLYAVWLKAETTTVDNVGTPVYFQNWLGCSELEIGDVTALTDSRDNQVYAVAKLADGGCWQIENMRLDFSDNNVNITRYNTNHPTSDFETQANTHPTSTSTEYDDSHYDVLKYSHINTTRSDAIAKYSYGNYYNWYTATAGNGTYDTVNESARGDICPIGWRLPTGQNTSGEFSALDVAMGGDGVYQSTTAASQRWRTYPNNFLYSGTLTQYRGSHGYYWSASAYGNHYGVYNLDFSDSLVSPGTDSYNRHKYIGASIRCLTSQMHILTVSLNTGVASIIIDGVAYEDGDEVALAENSAHAIDMTFLPSYEFDSWAATNAIVDSTSAQSTTITIGTADATLTANAAQTTDDMIINYNANGLVFDGGSSVNTVSYQNTCDPNPVANPRYSHTPNITDDGTVTGSYDSYQLPINSNEVITIPGAKKLHITITYETESNTYDWMSFWEGSHPEYTAQSDAGKGIRWEGTGNWYGKYGGTTRTTLEGTIDGDTVTFGFHSDDYAEEVGTYGYYAVIEGLDKEDEPVTIYCSSRSVVSGEYKIPDTASNQMFLGWSYDSTASTRAEVEFADVSDILDNLNLIGYNGETKTLYAVWSYRYSLMYNGNGDDGVGTMGEHTDLAKGDEITLFASNFSRAGYGFAGWNTKADGTGTSFGPNETITLTDSILQAADSDKVIKFYSIWIQSAGDLQNFSCNSLAPGAITALTDTRDNQTYAVAKLADDNCWMIENLRLDSANSSDSTKAQGYGGIFVGLANPEISNFDFVSSGETAVGNSLYSYTNIPSRYLDRRIPRYNNDNTSSRSSNTTNQSTDNIYSYGNYYNWAAAIADTRARNDYGEVADTSICPAGWHLPYGNPHSATEFNNTYGRANDFNGGNTSGGFYYLNYIMNNNFEDDTVQASKTLRSYPNNFLYSGKYIDSSTDERGEWGNYWSATANSNSHTHSLVFSDKYFHSGGLVSAKYQGFTVRCVVSNQYTLEIHLGTGVDSIVIDNTTYHDGDTATLSENSTREIKMNFTSGYEFDSADATGATIGETSIRTPTIVMGTSNASLTVNGKTSSATDFDQAFAAAGKSKVNGYYKMQDMNTSICNAITTEQSGVLIDVRDNQLYRVAKKKMGTNGTSSACWMMDNLNLGAETLVVSQLDETNTHLPADSSKYISASTFNSWKKTSGSESYTDAEYIEITESSSDTGFAEDIYGNKYGTLYNYAAASANTYNNAESAGTGDASYDICPAGWRLPTGKTTGEFSDYINKAYGLFATADDDVRLQRDLKIPFSGVFSNGTPWAQSTNGYGVYWESTRYDSSQMDALVFTDTQISQGSYRNRNTGAAVRCIAN